MENVFELNVHLVMKEITNQIVASFQNVQLNIQVNALTLIYNELKFMKYNQICYVI